MQVNVSVIQAGGPGPVIDKLTTARVTDFQNSASGDNALLKVAGMPPLKSLAIAQQGPHPGQRLTAVGFPAGVWEVLDSQHLPQPSFNAGTASGQQLSPTGTPTIEINADVSPGMSGGPTVNSDTGEVLGVNSEAMVNGKQAFNFITDAATLRDFLHKNNIQLGPTKPFPWVWVVVGVVTAAVVATLVLLALLGRRKGVRKLPSRVARNRPSRPTERDPLPSVRRRPRPSRRNSRPDRSRRSFVWMVWNGRDVMSGAQMVCGLLAAAAAIRDRNRCDSAMARSIARSRCRPTDSRV
jgi:serine protease Do